MEQDCLWSSNNFKKLNVIKQKTNFLKFAIFFLIKVIPHTPYEVQKDRFCSL